MAEDRKESQPTAHGGALAVAAARAHGVSTMFTLSGGHVFPLYDGAVGADPPMRLLDVRHEQTAVFAAEATARLTRTPGLAVLTAGPGVTNGVSAVTTAYFNGSPVVVLAGRAPDYRWGSGSLQEFDHPVLLAPITKRAWTEHQTAAIGPAVDEAFRLATAPHRGPVFLDITLEALFGRAGTGAGAGTGGTGGREGTGRAEGTNETGRSGGSYGAGEAGGVGGSGGNYGTGGSGGNYGIGGSGGNYGTGVGGSYGAGGAGGMNATGRSGTTDPAAADPDQVSRVARLIAGSSRPVLVLGSDVWTAGAEYAARQVAEELQLPVITNGQGRGILPAGHELLVTRARAVAFREADLVIVAGTPLDFRLGYGDFGGQDGAAPARVVHVADAPGQVAGHRPLAASYAGDLAAFFAALAAAVASAVTPARSAGPARPADPARSADPVRPGGPPRLAGPAHLARPAWAQTWLPRLQAAVADAMAADSDLLTSAADPIHPMRIYGELGRLLDDDAVVIGDGGDFVSYAGKYIEPKRPGGWLDPGPYGCLGTGLGYAIAARVARPSGQVVLLLGDGAAGFSLMDADTLVRHRLPVVMICGNNGIWGLEKHPMQAIYGYDVAADLQPQCRYDQVVTALGGAGELVTRPGDIAPALRRAFGSGVPYLVNVITDPAVAYPRSTTGI